MAEGLAGVVCDGDSGGVMCGGSAIERRAIGFALFFVVFFFALGAIVSLSLRLPNDRETGLCVTIEIPSRRHDHCCGGKNRRGKWDELLYDAT